MAKSIALSIGSDPALADRAAELSKCDLLTHMVGEFPELQGLMGRYYALHDREPPEVAEALREQYLPRFAGDALPATRTGMALSIADKLDTIAGIYATGQKPTGTRDPFGLRRAALGLLRTSIDQGLDLDLQQLIGQAVASAQADMARVALEQGKALGPSDAVKLAVEVYDYVIERLRAYYVEGNRRYHRDGRNVRRRAGDASRIGAGFRCPAAGAGAVPAVTGRREPRGSEQAHRQHPEEGDRAGG